MPSSSYVEHDREETLLESGDTRISDIRSPGIRRYLGAIAAVMLLGNVIEG